MTLVFHIHELFINKICYHCSLIEILTAFETKQTTYDIYYVSPNHSSRKDRRINYVLAKRHASIRSGRFAYLLEELFNNFIIILMILVSAFKD